MFSIVFIIIILIIILIISIYSIIPYLPYMYFQINSYIVIRRTRATRPAWRADLRRPPSWCSTTKRWTRRSCALPGAGVPGFFVRKRGGWFNDFYVLIMVGFTTLVDCGYQLYGIFQPNIFREALMMFNVLGCGLMNNYRGI